MNRTLRSIIVVTIAVASISGLAACQPGPPAKPFDTPGRSGWRYVGGDEFNGDVIDKTKWRVYHNTYGDGNKELACLTPNNVGTIDGQLAILARRQTITCPSGSVRKYSSGFLGSREVGRYYPMFGRFEIRAKLPHAQGLWPGFWLRHRNGASTAEVDIVEYFHASKPGINQQTLHLDGSKNTASKSTPFESPAQKPGWHTYAVEISQATNGIKFDFFQDEKLTLSYVDTKHAWANNVDRQATWDIAINTAVGGTHTGSPDDPLGYLSHQNRCSLGGVAPDNCITTGIRRANWDTFENTYYAVDYVRVYVR